MSPAKEAQTLAETVCPAHSVPRAHKAELIAALLVLEAEKGSHATTAVPGGSAGEGGRGC